MVGDTHTHTSFSADCDTEPEALVRAAVDAGLSSVTITDHYDFDVPYDDRAFDVDLDVYFDVLNGLRLKYRDKIKILTGLEVGQQPLGYVAKESDLKIKDRPFDYIIGSTHFIGRVDPYFGEFYKGLSKQEAYDRLLCEILDNISCGYDFDSIGHFDYVTRYGPYADKTMYYRDHSDLFDEIFKYLIREDKALEINTKSGTRVPGDPDILKRYRELGGFLITLGSDAHKPELVGLAFDRFTELLKSLGFKYCFRFENRKAVAETL